MFISQPHRYGDRQVYTTRMRFPLDSIPDLVERASHATRREGNSRVPKRPPVRVHPSGDSGRSRDVPPPFSPGP